MKEEQKPNFLRGGKLFKTQIYRGNPKTIHKNISSKDLKKSSVVKSDEPDILNVNNVNVFKEEKLLNIRKDRKHMTQLFRQNDNPDILLGLNEYKQFQIKNFHNLRKLCSNPIPDIPDILEPIKEDNNNILPSPDSINNVNNSQYEESKNPEKQLKTVKHISSLQLRENQLTDIKEKDETEQITEENRKNEDKNEIKEKEKVKKEFHLKKDEYYEVNKTKEMNNNNYLEEERKIIGEKQNKLKEEHKIMEEDNSLRETKRLEEEKKREEEKKENEEKIKEIEKMKNELNEKYKQNELKEKLLKQIEEKQKEKEIELNKKEEEIKKRQDIN